MAKIYIDDYGATYVTVYLGDLDKEYAKNDRTLTWTVNGGTKSTSIAAKASSSKKTTFTGLKPSTKYAISAKVTTPSGDSWPFVSSVTTSEKDEEEILISYWDWNSSNGTATAAQTQKAYRAITNQGPLSDFSYLVWNDLVDKTNEILFETSHTWDSTYASASSTKMTFSDRAITTTRYNSLRNNIRMRYSVPESEFPIAKKGEKIMGWYFVKIASVINDWIDSI